MPLQIIALEVAHPVEPTRVERNIFLLVDSSIVFHFAVHPSFDLVDDEIGFKFSLFFFFAQGHQSIEEAIGHGGLIIKHLFKFLMGCIALFVELAIQVSPELFLAAYSLFLRF